MSPQDSFRPAGAPPRPPPLSAVIAGQRVDPTGSWPPRTEHSVHDNGRPKPCPLYRSLVWDVVEQVRGGMRTCSCAVGSAVGNRPALDGRPGTAVSCRKAPSSWYLP